MAEFSVNQTTLVLNGRPYTDLHQDDVISLSFINSPTTRQRGRNSIVVQNHGQRDDAELTINLMRYSNDHKEMNRLKNSASPKIIKGTLKSVVSDSNGNTTTEVYTITNGSITNQGDKIVNDSDGNQLQSYTITCIARSEI